MNCILKYTFEKEKEDKVRFPPEIVSQFQVFPISSVKLLLRSLVTGSGVKNGEFFICELWKSRIRLNRAIRLIRVSLQPW